MRLAPLNRFKPSSKIFYWPFQGGTSFVDLLCFCSVLCLLCFVHVCLYVLCGHLLGKGWPLGSRLWCLLWVCHFPIGILGQVWYLIVSIPDLCNLITFMLSLSDKKQTDIIEAFNSTSRYLDDLLNIDKPYFEQMVGQIYPTELQSNMANSNTEAPFFFCFFFFFFFTWTCLVPHNCFQLCGTR